MRQNIICGLDIGHFKICATCGELRPSGKIEILGHQAVPAQGLTSGKITDNKSLTACLRELCLKLRQDSGLKIRRVYANIDHPDLKTNIFREELLFQKKTLIGKAHINRLVNSGISSNLSLERRVIHVGLKEFLLDNQIKTTDPRGRSARELRLELLIISLPIPTLNSLIKCLSGAGLILQDIVPSGYAQLLGLSEAPGPGGSGREILLDIGGGLIKINLFQDGWPKQIIILPEGMQKISRDVAKKLKVSVESAEDLKTRYGRVLAQQESINQPLIVKDRQQSKVISRQELCEIITAGVNHLLGQISRALTELDCDLTEIPEIIVTGGGAYLEGFLERAEDVLSKKLKLGFLHAVLDSQIQAQSALYATSIGLINFALQGKDGKAFSPALRFGCLARVGEQVRKLYSEYF
ncbi:MAG: cell division protein FtsA [Candidatus Omnitrophica bacterium]|nr:cell division protein FtsA [Candidatus Omnitrophota bacterium]